MLKKHLFLWAVSINCPCHSHWSRGKVSVGKLMFSLAFSKLYLSCWIPATNFFTYASHPQPGKKCHRGFSQPRASSLDHWVHGCQGLRAIALGRASDNKRVVVINNDITLKKRQNSAKLADDSAHLLGFWFAPRRGQKPCRHQGVGVP
jgi:hypothetical protein